MCLALDGDGYVGRGERPVLQRSVNAFTVCLSIDRQKKPEQPPEIRGLSRVK